MIARNEAIQHDIAKLSQSEYILDQLRKHFPNAHALREVSPTRADILDVKGRVIGHLDR